MNEEYDITKDVLHKVDLMNLNNGWNEKNENIIISIGENAASYKWMHEQSANYKRLQYNVMSITLIILSSALTAETIFIGNTEYTLDIIKRVFIYIVNVLTVLQTFLKSEENREKHSTAALAFSNLYHDIQQQMCMFRRDRTNATKYVGDCLKHYDSLIINSPDISLYVLKQFKSVFGTSNISVPDIADRIQKIEIINEEVPVSDSIKTHKIQNVNHDNQDVKITNDINNIESDKRNANIESDKRNANIESDKRNANIQFNKRNANIRSRDQDNVGINKPTALSSLGNFRGCNNLADIHNTFQIHGDISDKDLEKIDSEQLRELRIKFLKQKLNYEYQRFMENSHENE